MRYVLLVIAACLAAAGCGQNAVAENQAQYPARTEGPARPGGPKVTGKYDETLDPYLFDFGRIPDNKPVTHEFLLKNEGKNDLHVTSRTNSCGCTKSELDKETIPPGDAARVKVSFDPSGYRGRVSEFVYIETDDPDTPTYRFTIEADVQ